MAVDVHEISFSGSAEWEQVQIPTPTYHTDFPNVSEYGGTEITQAPAGVYSSIVTNVEPGTYKVKGWVFASEYHRFTESGADVFADTPLWGLRKKNDAGKTYYRYKPSGENPYSGLVYMEEVFVVPDTASSFNLWLFDYSYYVFNNHSNQDLILEKMVE